MDPIRDAFEKLVIFIEREHRLVVTVVIILMVVSGMVYAFYLGDALRFMPDELDYSTLATNLSHKANYSLDGENPTAYRPPGYPFVLAILTSFGGGIVHIRIFNFILLGLCAYVVYATLKEKSMLFAAVLGVFIVAAYPLAFYTAGTLYPQVFASMLYLLIIFLLTRDSNVNIVYILMGILIGYLILTVPTFIFSVILFSFWIVFKRESQWFSRLLLMLFPILTLIGLWSARNYAVFDTFIFISTNSGENLLIGNSENTTSNAGSNVDISKYTIEASSLSEVEKDRYYRLKALDYIRENPYQAANLYIRKVVNYFNYRNQLVTDVDRISIREYVMLITYIPLLSLLIFRLILIPYIRPSAFEILLISVYIMNAFFSAIFFTRIRFRLPFDFVLIMIVAIFIDKLIHRTLKLDHPPYHVYP